MADAPQERLPIKLILPNQGTQRKNTAGGSPPKPFRTVDAKFRQTLYTQVSAIQAAVAPQIARTGSTPIRVILHPKAVAKSHRPEHLFSHTSCPIIGAGRLGELFIKATSQGLERLERTIRENNAESIVKELSTVETIEPVTPALRRAGVSPLDILRHSPRGCEGFITRVRLFNYGADEDQATLLADFRETCREAGIRISQRGYAPSTYVFEAECRTVEDIDKLSRTVGVRSLSPMPLIRTIRPSMTNLTTLPANLPLNAKDSDFPVVVVVDGGISNSLPALESWVVGRDSNVAPQYANTDHGTFVAGLICWGAHLNPNLPGIDAAPCGVFDLQVIPNGDPDRGEVEELLESTFVQVLEDALKEHGNKFKVWNLSLGTNQVCSLDEFSPLAEQLDNLQEKYCVSFVISAGNFDTPPLLDFPRAPAQLLAGRITSPADSVLGVTVGSVSQLDYPSNGPKQHHPSPFSRHGAGPNYIIKPDLIHYGGTCSTDAAHIGGIRSVNGTESAENIGTSFATPLVSRTLAHIYHQISPTPSPVLARGLLTHHARDPRTTGRVPDDDVDCLGFGLPAQVPYCLECTPYTSTLVFEDQLRPGHYLEWNDFPYPSSLRRNGRYFGQVWMTVAFAPARGARWGTEYCETHIDAHFGVYYEKKSRKTGNITHPFKGLVPPEHKNPGILYESYQVEKLRKWAPVRTYHGDLGPRGERGDR